MGLQNSHSAQNRYNTIPRSGKAPRFIALGFDAAIDSQSRTDCDDVFNGSSVDFVPQFRNGFFNLQ